ncbi:MAG: tetratricopeptide repeat protein [Chloroflexi bacterium]|nr:tetratricopeptide repeat protein [Chloroflexota bacterium]MCC6895729.1 tetratricopeptide repeat protein [Anaerolineae bacterium]
MTQLKMLTLSKCIALPLLLLTLSACGVVALQIEEPIPTVTAVPPPISPPPIQSESSAGLVAREAPDDSEVLVKTVAMPHIVFAPDALAVEMFDQWAAPAEYMVVDKGRGLRLRINWSALWLTDSYGTGRLGMDVYLKSPDQDDFQFAQSAASQDFESWGADQRDELLDSTLYLPGSGEYQVRVEVNVHANNDNDNEDDRSFTYETTVIALDSPPKIPDTPEDFTPQFGDLESRNILLDWRGWRLGPCLVRADDMPDVAADIAQACVGVANGDWNAAAGSLMSAAENVGDNPALLNRLYQQLGMLAAVEGDMEKATHCFEMALSAAHQQNDALEVAIALRNLGIAQRELGDEAGVQNMWQSIQLSDQIDDWSGSLITYAQFGYYWESVDTLDWVKAVLAENDLPQFTTVERWLNDFQSSAS